MLASRTWKTCRIHLHYNTRRTQTNGNGLDRHATIAGQRRFAVSPEFGSLPLSWSLCNTTVAEPFADGSDQRETGNGDQTEQSCPNCRDRGVPCVTSLSRGQRRVDNPAPSQSPRRPRHVQRRESFVSRPAGVLSPNATSVGFSVHTEDVVVSEGNEILTPGAVDNLGERSSILPDDLVRFASPSGSPLTHFH